MKFKKILALGLVTVLTAAFVSGCGSNSTKENSRGDKGKIVVGLDDNFPPMGFKDENNEIAGFDVDLAKEATKSSRRFLSYCPNRE